MSSPQDLAKTLLGIEEEISGEKGEVALFVLALREDSPDRWDVLVGAPWLDADPHAGLEYLAKKLQQRLSGDDLVLISRVVPLAKDNPVRRALEQLEVHGTAPRVNDLDLGTIRVESAYLIRTKKAA